MSLTDLDKAPFPWFGGKARIAAQVWQRFGDVRNYVEPFFGSGAVLLNRPRPFVGSEPPYVGSEPFRTVSVKLMERAMKAAWE